jgi:hypothetical protein
MIELMGSLPAWVWGVIVIAAFLLLMAVVMTGATLRIRYSRRAGTEIDTRLRGIASLRRTYRRPPV